MRIQSQRDTFALLGGRHPEWEEKSWGFHNRINPAFEVIDGGDGFYNLAHEGSTIESQPDHEPFTSRSAEELARMYGL